MRVPGSDRLRRCMAQLRDRYDGKAVVLLYHRVYDLACDPWGLGVSPRRFAEHLEYLARHYRVAPLGEMVDDLEARRLRTGTVAITFDDGYADTLWHAKPALERHRLPATVFVTAGMVGSEREFWWDELEKIFLLPGSLPSTLEIEIEGQHHHWDLGDAGNYSDDRYRCYAGWRAGQPPPTRRHQIFDVIYTLLGSAGRQTREAVMDRLVEWAGVDRLARPSHRALQTPELIELFVGEYIEPGAHGMTHQLLSTQPPDIQRREIVASRSRLEAILGRSVSRFAYPHGLHSNRTVEIVREAGFSFACATGDRSIRSDSDVFRLPRRAVGDWSGVELAQRLRWWMRRS